MALEEENRKSITEFCLVLLPRIFVPDSDSHNTLVATQILLTGFFRCKVSEELKTLLVGSYNNVQSHPQG